MNKPTYTTFNTYSVLALFTTYTYVIQEIDSHGSLSAKSVNTQHSFSLEGRQIFNTCQFTKLCKLFKCQTFRKNIRRHIIRWAVSYLDGIVENLLTYIMVSNVYVFHFYMRLGVLRYGDSSLVILVQNWQIVLLMVQVIQQLSQPGSLLGGTGKSNVSIAHE